MEPRPNYAKQLSAVLAGLSGTRPRLALHACCGPCSSAVLEQLALPGVRLVEDEYDPARFYTAVKGLEAEPERGGRCTVCYRLRMERAAAWAAANGCGWFCTTLSISPHKDAARINAIGRELEEKYGVRHLPNDFKKQNGYKRSLELSAQYGLYRQDYCGCEFSARSRAADPDE